MKQIHIIKHEINHHIIAIKFYALKGKRIKLLTICQELRLLILTRILYIPILDDPDLKLILDAFGIKIPPKLYRQSKFCHFSQVVDIG